MTNPWVRLPTKPPYVLPEDKAAVETFNRDHKDDPKHKHFLHINELLPEPFVGPKNAPVVLLSNNPGFKTEDTKDEDVRRQEWFMPLMRKNLRQEPLKYPFLGLDPEVIKAGGIWWRNKLRCLIEHPTLAGGDPLQIVARSVLNVVLFPYASNRYKHQVKTVPSQQYSFDLVRDAVKRKAVIVLLRSGEGNQKAWLKAVPELAGKLHLGKNPQAPYISPGNCPGFFDKVVTAIKAFAKTQTGSA